MQMDTSFLTQYNPDIRIKYTKKKYFGLYLYKLSIHAPGGRLIDTKGDLTFNLNVRIHEETRRQSGFWGKPWLPNIKLTDVDIDLLDVLREIKYNKLPGIKVRIEEPLIHIYSENIEQINSVFEVYLSKFNKYYIKEINGPEDDTKIDILNSGAILRKKDIGYKYKVILRDGRYDVAIKRSLLQYFDNVGPDQIKLTPTSRSTLAKNTNYIWNLYFYSNDININAFIEMMAPGIILNCHELVVINNNI